MTDGNLSALEAHLAEIEAYEASQEPCPICDEVDCDCAEEAENDGADHKINMMKEDGVL